MLKVENIEINFNTELGIVKAVKDFSFQVKKGEIMAVVGESGSGKSVCALSITGLLKEQGAVVSKGRILFEGNAIDYDDEKRLHEIRGGEIAYIFQEPMVSLNPLHTIEKQITERLIYVEKENKKSACLKAVELLKLCGIKNAENRLHDYPHNFSGGERQRIMIATALACNPKLLIADEPTTALDVTVQQQILDLIKELKEKFKMSVLLITHDLGVVKKYADNIVVVKNGEVVEYGTCEEIFNNPKNEYTKTLINTEYGSPVPPYSSKEIFKVSDINVKYKLPKKFLKKQTYFHAVKNINFSILEGDSLGIVGESGSGKTSLVKALLHLIEFSGEIQFDNINFSSLTKDSLRKARKNIQIVFQDPFGSLNPRMTVGMIISEGLKAFGNKSKTEINQEVEDILLKIGLTIDCKNRYPHEFSGGQRQRIAIARAIVMKPKVIIFDEPTSSLDKNIQLQILKLLKELQKEYKITYIFISHDLHIVKSICNNMIVMKEGQVVEYGKSDEIIHNPQNNYTKSLIQAAWF